MTNKTCDFLVIGGGIAGASAACMLSAHGKVIIAERESAPDYHTTGRSAATLTRAYENETVSALITASVNFLETAHETGFSPTPLLSPRGTLSLGDENSLEKLDRYHAKYSPVVTTLQRLDKKQTLSLPGTGILNPDRIAGSVLEPDAADIDVHALHQAFLKNMKSNGGEIILEAEITSMKHNGKNWLVETKAGTIEANIVINAAGSWADEVGKLAGAATIGLQPMRRTVITFGGVPDHIDTAQIPFTRDIHTSFYFRPEGRTQILGSPADETPCDPCDAQPDEIDIATAADRIENAINFPIRRIEHKWAGLRNFVKDRLPVAGFDDAAPNFFWLAGQGGAGIKTSPVMARIAESLITGNAFPAELAAYGITPQTLSPKRLRS